MSTGNKKYVVYTICDDKYIEPCTTMLYSFLLNNRWFDGDIVVMYDNLKKENFEKIKKIDNNIKIVKLPVDKYKTIFENTNGIVAKGLQKAFFKYEVFKKQNYDIIIWLDSDMIIKENIETVFLFDDYDFVWCEDKQHIGKKNYFNTGFFAFRNCDFVKDGSFYSDLFSFTENLNRESFKNEVSYYGLYADQDVLNERVKHFFKKIKIEDCLKYNFPQQIVEQNLINNSKTIHYCGGGKPWDGSFDNKTHEYYYFYNEMKYKSKEVAIFGFNHKKTNYVVHNDNINTPLQVGKARDINNVVCPLTDCMLKNIGEKNRFYLETTGIYWIWKNVNTPIKGHEHYRRRWNLNEEEIKEVLTKNDIILPIRYDLGITIRNHYASSHSLIDIISMEYVIKKLHPEYAEDWNNIIANNNLFYYANCFIAKNEDYNKMCEFIFGVLNEFAFVWNFKIENDIKNHVLIFSEHKCPPDHVREGMSFVDYQMEIMAFMFERLINLYVAHNFKNVYETELIQMEVCGA